MSFKGTFFSKDVALVEPNLLAKSQKNLFSINTSEVDLFTITSTVTGKNITTFTNQDNKSIIASIQGVEYENNVLTLVKQEGSGASAVTKSGKFIVKNAKIQFGTDTAIESDLEFVVQLVTGQDPVQPTITTAELLGQLVVASSSSDIACKVFKVVDAQGNSEDTGYTVTISLNSNVNFKIAIDDVGAPDLTFLGDSNLVFSGAVASNVGHLKINNYITIAANLVDSTFSITAGSSSGEVTAITSISLSSVQLKLGKATAGGYESIVSVTLNGSINVAGSQTSVASLEIAPNSAVTTGFSFAGTDNVIVLSNTNALTITGADATVSQLTFKSPTFTIPANSNIPLRFVSANTTYDVFKIDCRQFLVSLSATSVGLFFDNLNYQETIHFLNHTAASTVTDIVSFNPSYAIYDKLDVPIQRNIINFSTDAGFVIPVVQNATVTDKYVKIADLYALALNAGGESNIPDLALRLHALEVAIYDICDSELRDATGQAAQELREIKNKYRELDISGL